MQKVSDLFLSFSNMEKYNLFISILEIKQKEATTDQLLNCFKGNAQLITDINIKQVAELLGRSYGSVYNTYMGLVSDLNDLLGKEDADLAELFSVEADQYYAYLTKRSYPYQFINAIVQGEITSFEAFYTQLGSSKATVLRHLKCLRNFLRARDIRVTYEPMGFVGKNELSIRIAITGLYWRAQGNYGWPFEKADHEIALRIIKGADHQFDINNAYDTTNELMALFVWVSRARVLAGHMINSDRAQHILRYAYPNLLKDYLDRHPERVLSQPLTDAQMMQETSALFLVFNLIPFYSETNKLTVNKFLQKIDYYNADIAGFVSAFLSNLPLEEHDALAKTSVDPLVVKANLTALLIGTLAFDSIDPFLFNTDDQASLDENEIEQTSLYKSLDSTLQHLVMDPRYKDFRRIVDKVLPAFYALLRPLLVLYRPESKVNVFIQVTPSFFDNARLEQMLKTLAFVNILDNSDSLQDVDLVICTNVSSLPASLPDDVTVMTWRRNPSSDLFGHLYSLIRQVQLNKETKIAIEEY
ncbi:helix-turn-helix domain-containing protein [Agrilactobacillus yilanensis]|uniref:Helix-turn-helix domain-containing protein n=1 Tax=Agrilactobacillus yilanensis TaxID=2485997 RepID=A0ABW4J8B0_9LACO|nr:helix-turn-helix domain-containing protein [Agrilactobacillus yilanensis]